MKPVLVLDDDEGNRRIASLSLRSAGYEVLEADNGADGLHDLQEYDTALVVLDLNMPGMNGEAFFRAARSQGYEGPVLIVSAYGAEAAQRRLPAQDYLNKPFDTDVLVDKVRDLVGTAN